MLKTALQLSRIMECPLSRAEPWLAPLFAAMKAYQIDTEARQAAFLAQVGHESQGLLWTCELWGPTAIQRGYEGRKDLGNSQRGDGYLYRGRGLIQITGRANYAYASKALEQDFVGNPDLLRTPRWAAVSAAWFWQRRGLNQLADAGQFQRTTRLINGGLIGEDDRVTRLGLATKTLEA